MMRRGTPLEWSRVLGVGPDDLPSQTRLLVRGTDVIYNAVTSLRMHLHECPDGELDQALLDLERAMEDVAGRIALLHAEVTRELR